MDAMGRHVTVTGETSTAHTVLVLKLKKSHLGEIGRNASIILKGVLHKYSEKCEVDSAGSVEAFGASNTVMFVWISKHFMCCSLHESQKGKMSYVTLSSFGKLTQRYKYQPKDYSIQSDTTNTLLSIYKSGNMFRLIEPSSGQFTNHTEGTFSRCAHCGNPNIYKSYDNNSVACGRHGIIIDLS